MSRDSLKRFLAASSVLLVLAASGAATDLQNIYSITPLGSNNISINGTIDLNGNNLTEPQRVDGIDLDNPGTGISVNSGRLEVTDNSITTTELDTGDVDSRYLLDSGDKMTGNLNMTGKSILDYFDNSCGENQAVKQIYDNGTVQCGQAGGGLPTVLDINKSANDSNINNIGTLNSKGQQLDLGGELDLTNDNITDSTGGNVTIRKSLKIYGQIWLNGTGSDSGNPLGAQNLSDVLEQGNSAGSYNIDVNGNALKDVGALYDDSNTQCGSDEFLNGKGSCKTDSFAADTDDQDLEDVLAQYNDAGAYDINLSGSEIQDTDGAITLGGGNVDIPDGDLDMTENNITNIDSLLDSTGSKTINFDGSNNVEVPNGDLETTGGDLNMSGNNLTSHQEVCAGDMCT